MITPTKTRKPLLPAEVTGRMLHTCSHQELRSGLVHLFTIQSSNPRMDIYRLVVTDAGYKIQKDEGYGDEITEHYDLPKTLNSCDCPDAIYRSERPGGCKHQAALRQIKAAGELPAY